MFFVAVAGKISSITETQFFCSKASHNVIPHRFLEFWMLRYILPPIISLTIPHCNYFIKTIIFVQNGSMHSKRAYCMNVCGSILLRNLLFFVFRFPLLIHLSFLWSYTYAELCCAGCCSWCAHLKHRNDVLFYVHHFNWRPSSCYIWTHETWYSQYEVWIPWQGTLHMFILPTDTDGQ